MKKQILLIIGLVILLGCNQKAANEETHQPESPIDYSEIKNLLDSIHIEDQKHRVEGESIQEKYGLESDELRNHWMKIRKIDSSNLIAVEKILNTYGWLSSEQIGSKANSTLFLVIQHSNLETQEKYLPMMRQAVKEGKARSQSLALLEDRICIGKGELQVYGSQIGTDRETGDMYVLPLVEPEKVNERRAEVGLGPIEDYISHWGLEWNVDEYKRELPKWIDILEEGRR